jgi:hypothetical protein
VPLPREPPLSSPPEAAGVFRGFVFGFGVFRGFGVAVAVRVAAGAASSSPAESGSEDRPMRWEDSLLAASVTPAATRSPAIAAAIQSARERRDVMRRRYIRSG